MSEDIDLGCARPSGGPVGEAPPSETKAQEPTSITREGPKMIKVSQKAPDFTAPAYYQGKFVNTSLSECLGKWVLLCFYPGDFTFV